MVREAPGKQAAWEGNAHMGVWPRARALAQKPPIRIGLLQGQV